MKQLKALNIRDYENNSQHRQAMGLFKSIAYQRKIYQAQMLKDMIAHCYKTGFFDKEKGGK